MVDNSSWAYMNPYHMLGLSSMSPKSHGGIDPAAGGGLPPSSPGAGLAGGSKSLLHPDSAMFWFAAVLAAVGLGFVGIHGGAHAGPAKVTAGLGQ